MQLETVPPPTSVGESEIETPPQERRTRGSFRRASISNDASGPVYARQFNLHRRRAFQIFVVIDRSNKLRMTYNNVELEPQ